MSGSLYSNARLYDLMYPEASGVDAKAHFYVELAAAAERPVLDLACGTGSILLPIARRGIACEGVDLSSVMLAEARTKLEAESLSVPLHVGDMASFDLGRKFGLVFIASNSLLHLHAGDDIVRCFRSVRGHLDAQGRFAFDVFNPSAQVLADADGTRREKLRFDDPERGEVRVDAEERYDAATQITRGVWYFSTDTKPEFRTVSISVRSIFPQELPLLIERGGLKMLERYGDFVGGSFTSESRHQVCVCRAA